jgi:hypothetical protein
MAMKAGTTARAPRGTKILIKAFFSAADEIPEGQRDEVVKAAFAGIRDEMKAVREKEKATKAKAREATAKPPKKAAPSKAAPKKVAVKKPRGKDVPSSTPAETAEA